MACRVKAPDLKRARVTREPCNCDVYFSVAHFQNITIPCSVSPGVAYGFLLPQLIFFCGKMTYCAAIGIPDKVYIF